MVYGVVYRAAARELSPVRGSQVEGSGRERGKVKRYTGRECPTVKQASCCTLGMQACELKRGVDDAMAEWC